MMTLTAFERSIRAALVVRAREAGGDATVAPLTYGDLDRILGSERRAGDPALKWPRTEFFEALGHVSMYEVEHGRPVLTALVVTKDAGLPGPGFEKLARHLGFDLAGGADQFWAQEVEEIVDFWGSDPALAALDRATEMLDDRLRGIQRLLRKRESAGEPQLARTIPGLLKPKIAPSSGQFTNVGPGPALYALYVGWLPSGLFRTPIFSLGPGPHTVELPLVTAVAVAVYKEEIMGAMVDGAAEVLFCEDGRGRWLRFRPRLGGGLDVGSSDANWVRYYQDLRRGVELDESR
jgi:hypothetical protein